MPLLDPVSVLPKVGPIRAEKLAQAGLRTVGDVLRQFPRAFEQRSRCTIAQASADHASVLEVTVIRAVFLGFGRSKRLEVAAKDDSGIVKLMFFNAQRINIKALFSPNQRLIVVGKVDNSRGTPQIVHPKVTTAQNAAELSGTYAIYPQIKGLTSSELSGYIRSALQHIKKSQINDPFAKDWLLAREIAPIPSAYHWIHEVHDAASKERVMSLRRFAFEEVLSVQLSMQQRKHSVTDKAAYSMQPTQPDELFKTLLPFEPTGAQIRVLGEIIQDMSSESPMGRLLQGDVGSGKTAVCAAACLMAARAKTQCAVLAPTDILVEQHFKHFKNWFEPLGFRVAKLTGSLKESEKREIVAKLKSGEIDIVVGTHALLSEGVSFAKLSLVVIDEQHRFGVEQRKALREKGGANGGGSPHLLVMTATPIPRSLALTLYGDMSLSIIDELPKGRSPISTQVIQGDGLLIARRLAAKMVKESEQAYIIYPLVAESEKLDLRNAMQSYEMLCAEFGKDNIALVHGQMKAEAKELAMRQFASGDAKVLISTTVVEVGVDVPNASYMLIMNAERFGLSQLHQLRGRVGRGTKKSYCYLATEKAGTEEAQARLSVMERTNNGFEIADADLAIRGPGDLLGKKQSGVELFNFFDFSKHSDLIELARHQAMEVIKQDPELKAPWVRSFVERANTFLNC